MANTKKRPGKAAKAARKILQESELLAAAKQKQAREQGSEFRDVGTAPKTAEANKPRPNKKRG